MDNVEVIVTEISELIEIEIQPVDENIHINVDVATSEEVSINIIEEYTGTLTWNDVHNKPTTFTPSLHNNSNHSETYVVTTDDRLSNNRIPLLHGSSHQVTGSDPIKLDDLALPDDNTDLNSTIERHGLLPKLSGETSKFLRADGIWEIPVSENITFFNYGTDGIGIFDSIDGVAHRFRNINNNSSKISVTLNNIQHTIDIDVNESAIIHDNLNGKGTYTHTQIDQHISSTDNPHTVTKNQLGLGNVVNVDTSNPSNIIQDSTHRFTTDIEKSTWNGKQDSLGFNPVPNTRTINSKNFSSDIVLTQDDIGDGILNKVFTAAEKTKLDGIATGAESNVQSDWNAISGDAFILNKPSIPTTTSQLTNDSGFITISSVPDSLSDLTDDSTHRVVTDAEKTTWNSKQDALGFIPVPTTRTINSKVLDSNITLTQDDIGDGVTNRVFTATEKSKLAGIATGAEVNVNADWNAISGDAQILNKPTIPNALSSLTDDSTHRLVTDTEKSTWNEKQDALGFTPVPTTRTVNSKALSSNITLDKTDIGLTNVDNTADANKSVLSATKLVTARTINGISFDGTGNITVYDSSKEPANSNIQTHIGIIDGNPHGTDKTDVGLSSVTNDAQLKIASNLSDVNDRQTSLNNLTAVSSATNEHVLTKDTTTGNAVWKVSTGGGSVDEQALKNFSIAMAIALG